MRTLNLLLVAAGLLASCGGKNVGPYVSLVVARPESGNACPAEGPLTSLTGLTETRLTVRIRRPDNTTQQICDLLLPADAKAPPPLKFAVPAAGSVVDFFAEAFEGNANAGFQRIASGALLGQSLTPGSYKAETPQLLSLVESESFRCLSRPKLKRTRAFHSATLLPNGQVLLTGGLANSPIDNAAAGNDFYILGSAEVYDPATQTLVSVDGSDTLTPRAFHQAAVLPQAQGAPSTRLEILLVGGISYDTTRVASSPIAFQTNTFSGNLRLVPNTNAPLLVPPTEILTYDTVTRTLTRRAAGYPATDVHPAYYQGGAVLSGRRLAIAGGLNFTPPGGGTNSQADLISSSSAATTLNFPGQRIGPGLVPIANDMLLLVGGNDPNDFDPSTSLPVEPVLRLDYVAVGYASITPISGRLSPLWFPTVTLFTVPSAPSTQRNILVSGGFLRDSNGAYSPSPQEPSMLSYDTGTDRYAVLAATLGSGLAFNCTASDLGHVRAVAWNAATPLADGTRILLSGGTPRYGGADNCIDCEEGDSAPLCSVHQALLYDGSANQLLPLPTAGAGPREGLQIARWGHTQTLLADGTVLVAGGFTRRGQCGDGNTCGSNADCVATARCNSRNTTGTVDLELFNPARGNLPASQGIDPDDPVRADLMKNNLVRELGRQAHVAGATKPERPCPTL